MDRKQEREVIDVEAAGPADCVRMVREVALYRAPCTRMVCRVGRDHAEAEIDGRKRTDGQVRQVVHGRRAERVTVARKPTDECAPDLVSRNARDVIVADVVECEPCRVAIDVHELQQCVAQQPLLLVTGDALVLEYRVERRMGVPQCASEYAGDSGPGLVPAIRIVRLGRGDDRSA